MIKIKEIQDKQFIKDMINLALETKDKKWFSQLTNNLKKIENKENQTQNNIINMKNNSFSEEVEVDLFNPKSNQEGYYDTILEYEYYTCETDCNKGQVLIVIDDKLYQFVNTEEELNKSSCFVRLVKNINHKKGHKIPKSDLVVYDDEYNDTYFFGYFAGQINYDKNISKLIDNKDNTIDFMDKKIITLLNENILLKSELKTLQDNYFNNNNKKSKWKFWKRN